MLYTNIHTFSTPNYPNAGDSATIGFAPVHTHRFYISLTPTQLQVVLRPQDPVVLRRRATGVGAGAGRSTRDGQVRGSTSRGGACGIKASR